jgi:hypothetical protein
MKKSLLLLGIIMIVAAGCGKKEDVLNKVVVFPTPQNSREVSNMAHKLADYIANNKSINDIDGMTSALVEANAAPKDIKTQDDCVIITYDYQGKEYKEEACAK